MAFRSQASTTQPSATSANLIVTMPAGIAVGDQLLCFQSWDSSSDTITPPAGWSSIGSIDTSGPDGQSLRLYTRIADGTEGSTQTWTGLTKAVAAVCAAWSGRTSSALTSSNVVSTNNNTSNASPISATLTGTTPNAADDLAVFVAGDFTASGGTWTFSTITGYTNQVTAASSDGISDANLQTRDNVSSGATGNLAVTLTRTAGSGNSGYNAFVVNIPQASVAGDILMGQICL